MALRLQSRSILYFDMVRQCGSIREAARRLHVAASAVHRQILNLEDEVGVPLFERLPEGLRLTAAGEVLTRHVQVVMKDARRTQSEFDALRGARSGEITVATVESAEFNLLPDALARMQSKHPGVQLVTKTFPSMAVPNVVLSGAVDIGLAFDVPKHPNLRHIAKQRFSFGAIVRPDHPLSRESHLTIGMCVAFPLILPASSDPMNPQSLHATIEPLLRSYRERLQIIAHVSSISMMRRMVARLGVLAFHSRLGLDAELSSGELVHLPLNGPEPLSTEFGIFSRKERSHLHSLDAFAEILRDELSGTEPYRALGAETP